MDKGQQLQSVLTIVMAILFGAFESEFIGVCMVACMAMLIISVARSFLSCLHGSEPEREHDRTRWWFLSCLHGSEHSHAKQKPSFTFLSCLHGSELH